MIEILLHDTELQAKEVLDGRPIVRVVNFDKPIVVIFTNGIHKIAQVIGASFNLRNNECQIPEEFEHSKEITIGCYYPGEFYSTMVKVPFNFDANYNFEKTISIEKQFENYTYLITREINHIHKILKEGSK